MANACRKAVGKLWDSNALLQASHPGVLLARYLRVHDEKGMGKRELLQCACKAAAQTLAVHDSPTSAGSPSSRRGTRTGCPRPRTNSRSPVG